MKNIIDREKQLNFINSNKDNITLIETSSILLYEKIHINGNTKELESLAINLKEKGVTELNNVVLVRPNAIGQYYLVTGFKGLMLARFMDIPNVKAIIINHGRSKQVQKTLLLPSIVDIGEIKIKKHFKVATPYKIHLALEYYKKYGELDKPVTVSKKLTLIDGYSRYLVAKTLGLSQIPVVYSNGTIGTKKGKIKNESVNRLRNSCSN